MLKHYITIALRNLARHKLFSLINIAGLTVGLACCLLIIQYIRFELSFDFNVHKDRIYRIANRENSDQPDDIGVLTSGPIGPALKAEFAEIDYYTRIQSWDNILLQYQDQRFFEELHWADTDFFKIFSYPLVKGDIESVLREPYSMVVSERMAEKYFGGDEPVGKILYLHQDEELYPFTITGVVKNAPVNSSIQFDCLASFSSLTMISGNWIHTNWGAFNYHTFLLLDEKTTPSQLNEKLPQFFKKYMGDHYSKWNESIPDFFLQPLGDIHLYSHSFFELETNGHITDVILYFVLGLLILFLACFNYINLSTAQYSTRTHKVGIRKVVGAAYKTLMLQFLGESALITLIAIILAFFLAEMLLPVFNTLVGQQLSIDLFHDINFIFIALLLALCVGCFAGFYPALYLAKFNPVHVLKRLSSGRSRRLKLRDVLVLAQFSIAILLLACTLLIYQQIRYMTTKDKGYKSENIVTVELRDQHLKENYPTIKNELLRNPNIKTVTGSEPPPAINECRGGIRWEGKPENIDVPMFRYSITSDYNDLYDLKLVEGRFFSNDYRGDRDAVLLNEAAVRAIGWESALNKRFSVPGLVEEGHVVGVVKDFHFHSLHEKIEPLFIIKRKSAGSLSIKVTANNVKETIQFIKETLDRFEPQYPFTYSFLENQFFEMYRQEHVLSNILEFFAMLSVAISCVGIFGLASFVSERRTKEIGIRKVLGANHVGMIGLLSKEFAQWVLFANLIAWPIAWFVMSKWLNNFVYRIEVTVWPFLCAGCAALVIAFLTTSWQVFRAARANPVETLRYE